MHLMECDEGCTHVTLTSRKCTRVVEATFDGWQMVTLQTTCVGTWHCVYKARTDTSYVQCTETDSDAVGFRYGRVLGAKQFGGIDFGKESCLARHRQLEQSVKTASCPHSFVRGLCCNWVAHSVGVRSGNGGVLCGDPTTFTPCACTPAPDWEEGNDGSRWSGYWRRVVMVECCEIGKCSRRRHVWQWTRQQILKIFGGATGDTC